MVKKQRVSGKMKMEGKHIPDHYRLQSGIPCCANCKWGGYLGRCEDQERLCICELMGVCSDSDYYNIAVEPLGICDAYKPRV